MDRQQQCKDYRRIEQALLFLEANRHRQPSLAEAAHSIGLSTYHFQRLFTRWAGITPKRFLQSLTKEHAKSLLQDSANLLDVAYECGLSSPGRLHDLFVQTEAITPGEYKSAGANLVIEFGFHPTPFGDCLLATTTRGICNLAFVQNNNQRALYSDLANAWPGARLLDNPSSTGRVARHVFDRAASPGSPVRLLLKGTNFQIKVWEALITIPSGTVSTYEQVAGAIGQPAAARAVGSAIGKNPIALLVPCHRVIRKIGASGDYHWGRTRKRALLGWEAATCHPD